MKLCTGASETGTVSCSARCVAIDLRTRIELNLVQYEARSVGHALNPLSRLFLLFFSSSTGARPDPGPAHPSAHSQPDRRIPAFLPVHRPSPQEDRNAAGRNFRASSSMVGRWFSFCLPFVSLPHHDLDQVRSQTESNQHTRTRICPGSQTQANGDCSSFPPCSRCGGCSLCRHRPTRPALLPVAALPHRQLSPTVLRDSFHIPGVYWGC